jgi:carbon storage regulator
MLVLSRKLGEKILIAGEVEVMVLDIDRGKVRLGIKAPIEVEVIRAEIAGTDRNRKKIQPKS